MCSKAASTCFVTLLRPSWPAGQLSSSPPGSATVPAAGTPKVLSPRVPPWSSEVGVGFGLAPNRVTTEGVHWATELISQVEGARGEALSRRQSAGWLACHLGRCHRVPWRLHKGAGCRSCRSSTELGVWHTGGFCFHPSRGCDVHSPCLQSWHDPKVAELVPFTAPAFLTSAGSPILIALISFKKVKLLPIASLWSSPFKR